MPDLLSVDDAKTYLGISGTAQDARLAALVPAAGAAVERYCQRSFLLAPYTEYHTGNNTTRIALRQRPVTAVTSVWECPTGYFGQGDPFDTATLLTAGTDYALQVDGVGTSASGVLLRLHTVWPMVTRASLPFRLNTEVAAAPGNIKVAYTAGFLDAPDDLKYATALLVRQMMISLDLGRMAASTRIGDYAYTLASGLIVGRGAELADVRHVLAPYRETGW